VRSARVAAVGKASTEGFQKNNLCTLPAPRSPGARTVQVVLPRPNTNEIPSYLGGSSLYLQECVEARRVRTDQRWDAGVGDGGGKHGCSARVRRSLDVD
jgi:hypothetical protein